MSAGVIALVAAYLTVNLVEFIVNWHRVGGLWRIERDRDLQSTLVADGRDAVIKRWVKNELGKPEFGVKFAAAFGSITGSYPTRDIDIVVQFDDASDQVIRKKAAGLQALGKVFEAEFNLPLHLQLFLETETNDLVGFARRAGAIEVLVGEKYWAEIFDRQSSTSFASE